MFASKSILVILSSWALIYIFTPSNGSKFDPTLQEIKFNISEDMVKELFKNLDLQKHGKPNDVKLQEGKIVANVNDFVDIILKNIGVFAVKNKFDPMAIDGLDQNFLVGHITLSNGSLNGISTITRDGDVNVNYSPSQKVADLDLAIKFHNIGFSYNYHVVIVIVGAWGQMIGKIQDCKVFVCLSFDFNTYVASIKQLKMMDSGHASINFIGGVVELVIDLLSEFLSVILHPFIIAIIQGVVQLVCGIIVDSVNNAINGTFVSPVEAAQNSNITRTLPQLFFN